MNRFLTIAAGLALLTGLRAEEETFRSDARVVNVNALVRTVGPAGNKALAGLSAENFRLKIDGKERKLRYFREGDVKRQPLAVMIYFNLAPEGALRQLSQSAVQASFANALRRLASDDEVTVYAATDWFAGQPKQVSPLGRDRESSAAALSRAVRSAEQLGVEERKRVGQSRDRSMSHAVDAAVDLAARMPDRQVALVYISDGMNTLDTMLAREREPLLERLLESNISFSAINLDMKASYAAAAATLNPLGKLMGFSVSGFGDAFAKQTGGLSIDIPDPEKLGAALEEVVSAYAFGYSLGYQCRGDEFQDNRWHKVEVVVKGITLSDRIIVSARKRFRYREGN